MAPPSDATFQKQPDLPQPAAVAEYTDVDEELFQTIRAKRGPAVLRGLASKWPAVAAARHSDEELITYLRRFASKHPVPHIVGAPDIEGRFLYSDDLLSLNFKRGMSPLDPFLDWLLQQRPNPRPYAVAVQSQQVPSVLPGFERENQITLVRPEITPRAWLGNRVRVAPHYDLTENVGVVVAGRRRFTLFPPDQVKNLYVGPLELTPAGTPVSLVDLSNPDLERFPKFKEALGSAQVTELGPGDAIYIPFYWWHGVDSLEAVNLFINYWWSDGPEGTGSPHDALIYAMYAIKVLPPEQRDVWRDVFDHYIFERNGNPAEHLPERARGVLGDVNAQVIERMTDYIRLMLSRFDKA